MFRRNVAHQRAGEEPLDVDIVGGAEGVARVSGLVPGVRGFVTPVGNVVAVVRDVAMNVPGTASGPPTVKSTLCLR